ncbi:MAG: cupin domain-containing protein [Myxococcales bacterium]|nr:cupin domain-containing protein [Myxococcales bacterium]
MPVRRIVTGLNDQGRARAVIDAPSPHVTESPAGEITEIWSSAESPASYDFEGDRAIFPMKHDPLPNGTICRVLEMKPGIEIPVDTPSEVILQFAKGAFQNMQSDFEPTLESVQRHPTFHKTDSLDYLVVLSGRLTMLMDDDAEVTLEPGNVVVQQGVMHGWRVEGDEPVRVFAVLVSGATATLP